MNELSRFTLSLAYGQTTPFDFDRASVELIRRSRLVARRMEPRHAQSVNGSSDTITGEIHLATQVLTPFAKPWMNWHSGTDAVNQGEWVDPLPYRWMDTSSRLAA